MQETLNKSEALPEGVDPNHKYVFRSDEFGSMRYWYKDLADNYWLYSNAPTDTKDYDPFCGPPVMDMSQPMPHTAPQFFSEEGKKRFTSVPEGTISSINPKYDRNDSMQLWNEVFVDEQGMPVFVYLDTDVKELPYLYAQGLLRIVNYMVPSFRFEVSAMFNSPDPKSKVIGAFMMLVDQGLFQPKELIHATVDDVEVIDKTVKIFGRKLVVDDAFLEFLGDITRGRDEADPLFLLKTAHGVMPLGINFVNSYFESFRVSPQALLSWNLTHFFSRVYNRLSVKDLSPDDLELQTFSTLRNATQIADSLEPYIDVHLRKTLTSNYKTTMQKSLTLLPADDFGVLVVRTDITDLRQDEVEFSNWLRLEPMHDMTASEQAELNALAEQNVQDLQDPELNDVEADPEPVEADNVQ